MGLSRESAEYLLAVTEPLYVRVVTPDAHEVLRKAIDAREQLQSIVDAADAEDRGHA